MTSVKVSGDKLFTAPSGEIYLLCGKPRAYGDRLVQRVKRRRYERGKEIDRWETLGNPKLIPWSEFQNYRCG